MSVYSDSSVLDELVAIDWQKAFKKIPELPNLIKEGIVVFRDGVVYYTKKSKKTGILAHLPTHIVQIEKTSEENLLKISQQLTNLEMIGNAQILLTGITSCINLGAIVIQTKYLADKIDNLQQSICSVEAAVVHDNDLYYLDKISRYFSQIETARQLLNSGTNNKQILGNVISLFIVSHNEVMSNLKLANDILFERVIRSQELPKDIMSNYLNFQKNTTILLPYASYILSRLCDRAKDFKLSNSVLNYSKEKYDILSESLLNSFEKTRENICKGKSTKLIELFSDNQRHLLKSSIENKVNEKLFSTFELPNVS